MARFFNDSVSNYLANNASPPVTAMPLTILAWAYPTDITSYVTLASIGDTAGTANLWAIAITPAGAASAFSRGTSFVEALSTTTTTINTWAHVAGVFTTTTSRDAYLNGGGKGSNATLANPTGIDAVSIGIQRRSIGLDPMAGRIAQVAVLNIAAAETDIARHARGVHPRKIWLPSQIVGLWELEGLASPEPDSSGNGRNLTIVGTVTAADHAPLLPIFRARMIAVPVAVAAAPVYTQTKFRVYNDDGLGL